MRKTRKIRWRCHLLVFGLPIFCLALALLIGQFDDSTGKGMSYFFAVLSYYFAAFAAVYGIIIFLQWLVRRVESHERSKPGR